MPTARPSSSRGQCCLEPGLCPLGSVWPTWPVLGLKHAQGQRHLWPDLQCGLPGGGRCCWQVPLVLFTGSGHLKGPVLCLGLLWSLPTVPGPLEGCYLWGSFLEWHLPPVLLWLESRAQPPPTETPVGPAPGALAGARFPFLLPYFSDSPRLSSSMEHLPGAWRGCGGQPSVQWIRSYPALSSSWWRWGFSSDKTPGWTPAQCTAAKLGPSLASLVRPGSFPSGQLTRLLSEAMALQGVVYTSYSRSIIKFKNVETIQTYA